MRIHALITGSLVTNGRRRVVRRSVEPASELPVYAWAIEHDEGLLVVDTGPAASLPPREEPSTWRRSISPSWAQAQIKGRKGIAQRLVEHGLRPADVRWVVLTHLAPDHAGGLDDLPGRALASETELAHATGLRARLGRDARETPCRSGRLSSIDFYRDATVGPLQLSYPLTRDGDILLVPTPGRSPGHLSVVAEGATTTIVIAGDASYTEEELVDTKVVGAAWNRATAEESLRRLRAYCARTGAVYLPSHDHRSGHRLRDGIMTVAAMDVTRHRLGRGAAQPWRPHRALQSDPR
jgi:glyoxylase-like metal-dependent hydrolase (beta-lactamase superfamily II)